ncbi:MAG: hypothetical protein C4536_06040 [Actinobacteria bacterium]|jgi:hypothetical protein|nr:MAG: hypothetical protein C4536_06040 [Actinomycetota bacterium]
MRKKGAIVVTTIGKGDFIHNYLEQIKAEDASASCTMFVIPDRKSPHQLFQACEEAKIGGGDIRCPTLAEQEDFLNKLGDIGKLIPYDSDNRRNVGFLMALEAGCDFLVSIDDDNHCIAGRPFLAQHALVAGEEVEEEAVHSFCGWYNTCELVETEPPLIYPRGFPYHARFRNPDREFKAEIGRVHINEGLWLRDPDVDAITWLACRPQVKSFAQKSLLLGNDTWAPVNTQNTALAREAIAAFYFLRMGYEVGGLRIDRYGDIFSGYFCQACARHLGFRVRVGTPVALHERNSHDHLCDLQQELACILLLEDLSEWLRELKLEGKTYQETYLCLAEKLEEQLHHFKGSIWSESSRGYFKAMVEHMRAWIEAVVAIGL